MRWSACIVFALIMACCVTVRGQALVAPTEPLTPEEQQKKFHLPPGFEIQLVASEPDVHKPMNMKFDKHGRLWVTHSLEYPFAAKSDEVARDAITIFSELGADGKAAKVHRYAEHLNIPIGLLPISDSEVIAWSIPNIYRLLDTNNDGVADKRTVAFGPFGFNDTHGNQNSFTRWIDGWVYANHGFSNQSKAKFGGVGDVLIEMQSGNTYRFKSHDWKIEQYSWGQVNPFGLSFDPLGNLYSADCHSRAVTMLLREGYYQSFGKPHDGLGFAPDTTDQDHGGTGLCGVVYSTLPQFPPEYRDVLFVCNVVMNRVHCDRLKWNGSSPTVEKVEDFLTCDDPWFRPVDIQPGPDGALYVADFYNCIIGHYEVPLTHPKRDRERGRLWRIVYSGKDGQGTRGEPLAPVADLAETDLSDLVRLVGHPNLMIGMGASNELIDRRFGKHAAAAARSVLGRVSGENVAGTFDGPRQRALALWIVQRTEGLDAPLAEKLLHDAEPIVRVHTIKALGETANWQDWHFGMVRAAANDADPFVKRAAAEALAKHPAAGNLEPLMVLLDKTDPRDEQLVHQTRIALRDQLRVPEVVEQLPQLKFTQVQPRQLLSFLASSPTGPAARYILAEARRGNVSDDLLLQALPNAVQVIDPATVDELVAFIHERFAQNRGAQLGSLRALHDGLTNRGLPSNERLDAALADLLRASIAGKENLAWQQHAIDGSATGINPWGYEQRQYQDGTKDVPMLTSLKRGEQPMGVLRSPPFELPQKLSLWMCGHNGPTNGPDQQKNYLRLVLEDGTEAARSYPPRNDVAQKFEWNLAAFVGKRGAIEIIDGLNGTGYAWLAVSRFEPPVVRLPENEQEIGSSRADVVRLAARLKLRGLTPDIKQIIAEPNCDASLKLGCGEALVMLDPAAAIAPLSSLLADAKLDAILRTQAAQQLGRVDSDDARAALLAQLKTAPQPVAVVIAAAVAGHNEAAASLLTEIRDGRAPVSLLKEPTVLDRLKASKLDGLDAKVAELTANLSPADNRIAKLIEARRRGYLAGKFDPAAGKVVFSRSVCANCHRVGEMGKNLGPALDGIGVRGLDRLLEDVLNPSQNVDQAFRTVLIATDEGQSLAGFGVREEGETLVMHDSKGEQVRLPLKEIAERSTSTLSPMPAGTIEQMPEQDFLQLMAFLLSLQTK